eukprot:jgi/Undpi1/12238/HiC_scaffold_5.g01914.m1
MGTDRKPSGASKLGNMVRMTLLLLLGASLAVADPEPAVVGSIDPKPLGSVLALDSDSLDKALAEGGLLMLDFYAPWCDHCKKLEPEYEKAALDLAKDSLVLGKVDCDANEVLCREDRWDIEGFPTVKVVRGSTVHDYRGPRSAGDIAAFMRQVAAFGPEDTLDGFDGRDYDDEDDEDDDEDEGDNFLEDDGMLVLGLHDFDRAADRFVLMLIMFHATGCKGCKEMEPEFTRASDELYEYGIPLAKASGMCDLVASSVDCFAQSELCGQARWGGEGGVDGKTPSLFAIRDGKVFDYGDRPLKRYNMVPFMKKLAGIDENYEKQQFRSGEEDEDEDGYSEDDEVDESRVLSLDTSTIDAALKENDVVMLEFFAPWCGNCVKLAPKYARAAEALAGTGVVLAKVDCMENHLLCGAEPYSIKGYPTLFLAKKGKTFKYEGKPETRDIVEFMLKVLNSIADTEDFILDNDVAVIGLFQEEDIAAHKKFLAVAESDLKLPYGVSFNVKEVHASFDMEEADEIIVLKDFDEMQLRMSVRSFTTEDNIRAFVRASTKRRVLKMGTQETNEIMAKRPLAMIVMTEDEEEPSPATLELLEVVHTLAKVLDAKGDGVFQFVIGEKNRKGNVPSVALVAPGTNGKVLKYLHKGEMTLEALQEFEKKYFAGELEQHFKSEVLSPGDNTGPLKVVKGQTFKSMVIDSEENVLLEFYAPWCGHCNRLEPIYKGLAEKLERRDNLVVAKMDISANDVNHPGVGRRAVVTSQLPAIYYFRSGSKDTPEAYEGVKDAESLEAFVDEMALQEKAPVSPDGIRAEL